MKDDPFQFAFNPALASQLNNVQEAVKNPFLQQIGLNLGNKVVDFTKKYDSILHKIFSSDYRYYFDVDNKYVAKKILIIMAPFVQLGEWSSQSKNQSDFNPEQSDLTYNPEDGSTSFKHMGFSSPRSNIHAPDLYIPLMSLVTFILVCCFSMGYDQSGKNFEPQKIGDTFWKCVVVSILELIVFKIVFCFLDGNKVGTFDLVSHLNYRYVTLCQVIVMNMLIGGNITMFVTWYFLLSQGFFVYKTLRRYTSNDNTSSLELSHFGQKIIGLLSIIQPFFSWVLLKIIGEY